MRTFEWLVNTMALRAVLLAVLCGIYFGWARSQLAAQQSARAQQSGSFVLRGGRLIDGTGRAPVENSVVLIEGGKIARVGREGEFAIPAGATAINATGKTIIPGLVDGHTHIRNYMQPLFLYWGVTTVVDYRNVATWLWAEREAIEKGAVVGPNIFIHYAVDSFHPEARRHRPEGWSSERWGSGSGPEGRGVSLDLYGNGNADRRWVSDAKSLEEAVLEAKQAGYDAIQLYQSVSTPLMKTAVEIAHRHGLPVIGQFTSPGVRRGTDEILDTGIDVHVEMHGVEMATSSQADQETIVREAARDGASGVRSLASQFMNPATFAPLAQKMVDRKMFLAPTLVHYYPEISKHREEFDRFNTTFLEGPVGSLFPDRDDLLKWNKPYKDPELREKRAVGLRKVGEFLSCL